MQYKERDVEKAKELRKNWCNCCDEFGKMVSEEVKTNPRYKGVQLFPGKDEEPR